MQTSSIGKAARQEHTLSRMGMLGYTITSTNNRYWRIGSGFGNYRFQKKLDTSFGCVSMKPSLLMLPVSIGTWPPQLLARTVLLRLKIVFMPCETVVTLGSYGPGWGQIVGIIFGTRMLRCG